MVCEIRYSQKWPVTRLYYKCTSMCIPIKGARIQMIQNFFLSHSMASSNDLTNHLAPLSHKTYKNTLWAQSLQELLHFLQHRSALSNPYLPGQTSRLECLPCAHAVKREVLPGCVTGWPTATRFGNYKQSSGRVSTTWHPSPLPPLTIPPHIIPQYSIPHHCPHYSLHILTITWHTFTPLLTVSSHHHITFAFAITSHPHHHFSPSPHTHFHHHLTLTLTITSHPHQNSWFLLLLAVHKELFPEADGPIVISQEASLSACSQHGQARFKDKEAQTAQHTTPYYSQQPQLLTSH